MHSMSRRLAAIPGAVATFCLAALMVSGCGGGSGLSHEDQALLNDARAALTSSTTTSTAAPNTTTTVQVTTIAPTTTVVPTTTVQVTTIAPTTAVVPTTITTEPLTVEDLWLEEHLQTWFWLNAIKRLHAEESDGATKDEAEFSCYLAAQEMVKEPFASNVLEAIDEAPPSFKSDLSDFVTLYQFGLGYCVQGDFAGSTATFSAADEALDRLTATLGRFGR